MDKRLSVIMPRDDLIKNIKLIVIIALIIGLVGAVLYLIYGFTFLWQAMAATIFSFLLSVIALIFIFLSVYLWIKNLLLKRELNQSKGELQRVSNNLKKCNTKLRKIKQDSKNTELKKK